MKISLLLFAVAMSAALPSSYILAQTTLDAQQSAFLTLINTYRAQNGVGTLQVSATLQQSSQWMSNDLATHNYFSHTDSLGRDPFTRMTAFGYTHYPEGENIAAGYSDAQSTLTQWQNACDPDASGACTYAHRQNMLNPSYQAVGIGRAYSASSTYGWYWTTDFGGYVDQPLTNSNSPAPSINSFTSSQTTISAGQQVTLKWSVSGAISISIDNGIGNVTGLSTIALTPAATTTYTLTATNASGTSISRLTVTVNNSTSAVTTSIWPKTASPTMYLQAGGPIEFGVKFRSDVAGRITGISFYKLSANSGSHTGSLWTSTGQLLATGMFSGETASGWQTMSFSSPIPISAHTTYIASYHTNSGIAAVGLDLQTSGKDNPPLHALQTGVDGSNGVYTFSTGGVFPSQGTSGYNFWVDVAFAN